MSIESVMLSNRLILCCPLLLLLQSFQELGSFPVSWLFPSGGQSIVTSASASVLLMNIQGWFPIGFTGLISLQSRGLSRAFFSTTVQNHQFGTQPSYIRQTTGKTIALTTPNFVSTVMSLLFNILSTLVIVRESIPRQVDKKSRGPHGERGLEFWRRKKGQTFFPPLHSLGLYNNNVSCLRTVSGKNLLANSVISKCKLWE